jgi:uncharacterized protein (UPF0276 family)
MRRGSLRLKRGSTPALSGAGLGLRRSLLTQTLEAPLGSIDFLEVAPENWIGFGGRSRSQFELLVERCPLVLHGLSLDLGGKSPLNTGLLRAIRDFMQRYDCPVYSEHLTACGDHGQLYNLMPLSFTAETVRHVAERIRCAQDILGERMAIENASYYLKLDGDMSESDFINAVIEDADCNLMLDVNNIIVNSINHGYDPIDFLHSMPGDRIAYLHVAGHAYEDEDLRVDTHAAEVPPVVWDLLAKTFAYFGVKPTLLERDSSFPPFEDLLAELEKIRVAQQDLVQ